MAGWLAHYHSLTCIYTLTITHLLPRTSIHTTPTVLQVQPAPLIPVGSLSLLHILPLHSTPILNVNSARSKEMPINTHQLTAHRRTRGQCVCVWIATTF